MNLMMWLMRMSRWARNPPSGKRVIMIVGIIAVGLAIAGIEALGLWPDALTLDRPAGGIRLPR